MEEVQEEEGEDREGGRRREEKEVKTSSIFESRLSFPDPPCLLGSNGTVFPRLKDDFPPWLCPPHTPPCRVAL